MINQYLNILGDSNMSEKQEWLNGIKSHSQMLHALVLQAQDLTDKFWAKRFNSGGADVLAQKDIDQYFPGRTYAEVMNYFAVLEQFVNWYENKPVTQADRKTVTLGIV
jgi:hypothetical protein